jgi:hypothetical protein
MNAYGEGGELPKDPLILHLRTRRNWVINFTLWPRYLPRGRKSSAGVLIEYEAGLAPQLKWAFWRRQKTNCLCRQSSPESPSPQPQSRNQLNPPGSAKQRYKWKWQVFVTIKTGNVSHIIYTCHIYMMFSSRNFIVTKLEQIQYPWLTKAVEKWRTAFGSRSFTSTRLFLKT